MKNHLSISISIESPSGKGKDGKDVYFRGNWPSKLHRRKDSSICSGGLEFHLMAHSWSFTRFRSVIGIALMDRACLVATEYPFVVWLLCSGRREHSRSEKKGFQILSGVESMGEEIKIHGRSL
ncbi:hypothetical protein LINGRAHAP2_LOCUS29797 [Linum grandiflorum]